MNTRSTKSHHHFTFAFRPAETVAPPSRGSAFACGSAVLQYVPKDIRAAGLIRLAGVLLA